ncbi:hypothetical protein [Chryseobacterium gleum]|uniref:hypothetical protein n=1 Tax=Chryseobacterium gleum TaxID=250 RepID=UPI0031DB7ABE
MKKKNQIEKRLSLKKLQMAKINNPKKIRGGVHNQLLDTCMNGDNGSMDIDQTFGTR